MSANRFAPVKQGRDWTVEDAGIQPRRWLKHQVNWSYGIAKLCAESLNRRPYHVETWEWTELEKK